MNNARLPDIMGRNMLITPAMCPGGNVTSDTSSGAPAMSVRHGCLLGQDRIMAVLTIFRRRRGTRGIQQQAHIVGIGRGAATGPRCVGKLRPTQVLPAR